MPPKGNKVPSCHPERKYRSLGLCAECYRKQWYHKTKERLGPTRKIQYRKWELKTLYNITPEKYIELLNFANNRCQVCGDSNKLCIDHCHTTGRIRGILCHKCNMALGHYEMVANNPKFMEYFCGK